MADIHLDDILGSLKKMSKTTKQLVKDIDDIMSKVNVLLDQRTIDEYD